MCDVSQDLSDKEVKQNSVFYTSIYPRDFRNQIWRLTIHSLQCIYAREQEYNGTIHFDRIKYAVSFAQSPGLCFRKLLVVVPVFWNEEKKENIPQLHLPRNAERETGKNRDFCVCCVIGRPINNGVTYNRTKRYFFSERRKLSTDPHLGNSTSTNRMLILSMIGLLSVAILYKFRSGIHQRCTF